MASVGLRCPAGHKLYPHTRRPRGQPTPPGRWFSSSAARLPQRRSRYQRTSSSSIRWPSVVPQLRRTSSSSDCAAPMGLRTRYLAVPRGRRASLRRRSLVFSRSRLPQHDVRRAWRALSQRDGAERSNRSDCVYDGRCRRMCHNESRSVRRAGTGGEEREGAQQLPSRHRSGSARQCSCLPQSPLSPS